MRKWAIGIVLILGAVIGVSAQDAVPLGSIASLSGDFQILGVTSDGARLIVADTARSSARVYNFTNPARPRLLNSVELDGNPVALIAAENFALVTVTTGDGDLLQVIARPSYNPRQGYINYGTYDVIRQPTGMAISPSAGWGVAYGENGYTLLELLSADEINSVTMESKAIADAALTDSLLMLLPREQAAIEIAFIASGPRMQDSHSLALDAHGISVASNSTGSLAAVLLEDNTVVLFDTGGFSEISRTSVEGTFTSLQFLTRDEDEWLLLSQSGESAILVLDISDSGEMTPLDTLQLETPLQALTVHNDFMITVDGDAAIVYAAE